MIAATGGGVAGAVADIAGGRMVVIVDDEDRENEGDIAVAADAVTAEDVNFMVTHGRGMVCVAMEGSRLDELGLPAMVDNNTSSLGTAFTVTVDALGHGVTTGISASDRATTIRLLCDPRTLPSDLARPGHVLPVRARPGGVLERAGHTEAVVDLCRLAGRRPAGVMCEVMRADGSMARRPDLESFAATHGLRVVTINDLIAHRRRTEQLVARRETTRIPTIHGTFALHAYEDLITHATHVSLALGDVGGDEPVLVRVHSECLTGDALGSQRCDCRAQLEKAMAIIGREGRGILVYLRQEGRGIGLMDKLHAYALQDRGLDTVDANAHLGHPPDKRDYGIGQQIIADLGVSRIRVLTNNPRKYYGLRGYGLEIVEQIPLVMPMTEENRRYLEAKRDRLGHIFDGLVSGEDPSADGEGSSG